MDISNCSFIGIKLIVLCDTKPPIHINSYDTTGTIEWSLKPTMFYYAWASPSEAPYFGPIYTAITQVLLIAIEQKALRIIYVRKFSHEQTFIWLFTRDALSYFSRIYVDVSLPMTRECFNKFLGCVPTRKQKIDYDLIGAYLFYFPLAFMILRILSSPQVCQTCIIEWRHKFCVAWNVFALLQKRQKPPGNI